MTRTVLGSRHRTGPDHLHSMTLQLGILFALLCAVGSNLAFFFKHRGACAAPAVDIRRPLQTAADALVARSWFAIGMGVGGLAWLLHVAALSLAPMSIVQAVVAGGVALIAVMADRIFGMHVGRRQWWGLGLTAAGLVLLAVTMPAQHRRARVLLARPDDRLRGRPARRSARC